MAKKFSEEDIYRLKDAYNTDELISPAHNQAKMDDMIRGVKTRTIEEGLKEDINRDIARKNSPLFEVNSTTITTTPKKKPAKEETTTAPKETPTKDSTASWWEDMLKRIGSDASYAAALKAIEDSATTTELEEEQIGHDPLAEEAPYDYNTTVVEQRTSAQGGAGVNDIVKALQADPSYKAAATYLESLGFEKDRHADILAKNPNLYKNFGVRGITTEDLDVTPITYTPDPEKSVDPYAQTRLAQQEEMKSWRQMLIDSHKKREEERTKRLRSEQILGIGKALGDLLGAAFAGAGSTRGNYAAVVPQAQAPKSVERVQQLINEGVVNARDYDKMMQALAMQEGKDRIALAKAADELSLRERQLEETRAYEAKKLAEQREYEEKKLEKAHERQKELIGLRHTNTITQLTKRGENAVAAAQARSGGKKAQFSDGDLAIIGAALPEFIDETTEKPNKYGEMETTTKKKPYKPTDNDMVIELARQKDRMKHYKLDPNSEDDKARWATIVSAEKALIAALPNVEPERIMEALLVGYTGEEVLAHFKK